MAEEDRSPPESYGIEAAVRKILNALERSFQLSRKEMAAAFVGLSEQIGLVRSGISRIEGNVAQMATRQQLDDAKAALGQAISDAATRVSTDIQALRDQIASGSPISDQDLADIQDDVNKLGQIDPVMPPASK